MEQLATAGVRLVPEQRVLRMYGSGQAAFGTLTLALRMLGQKVVRVVLKCYSKN